MEKIYDQNIVKTYLSNRHYRHWFSDDFDDCAYIVKTEANETIIHQGEEGTTLYFLIEGRCRVQSYNQEGNVFIINTINAPEPVGEIELISGDDSFSVETVERSVLIALPFSHCRQKLLKDSRFLLYLCELLSEKERRHALKLGQLASFPLVNRLSEFILDNASEGKLSLKKTVIAESLGVSYRHLEKVMKDLTEANILAKNKKVYTINDRKKLEEKAAVLDIF